MLTKKEFLERYQKVPVVEYPSNTAERPLVTVGIVTYQHEMYIRQCLEGVLMQQTNFDFEILIGEDASSDKTREICIEYAEKFPDKIKLFLHARENNILTYGKPSAHFNYRYNLYSAKGKYWATCDGDDYWIDPHKLQKQVDFLEANEDYGLIYSDKKIIGNEDVDEKEALLLEDVRRNYELVKEKFKSGAIFWDLLECNLINTLTVCLRKDLLLGYFEKYHTEEFCYDYREWLYIAIFAKIKYVDEQWAASRVHGAGLSNSNSYIDRRLPLVKQVSLFNYLTEVNNNPDKINTEMLLRTLDEIVKSTSISDEEKEPTLSFLKRNPKYLDQLTKA